MLELFVPGRLCLFGEHSDWAAGYRSTHPEIPQGYCLVAGTDQGLHAHAAPANDLVLESVLPDGSRAGPERIALEPSALERAARAGGFFSYAAGTAAVILERFEVGGLHLSVERADLPIRKGLSSSAAICVMVARAFDRLYGLGLSTEQEMALAYAGERLSGSECGAMDQVCAFGRGVSLLVFDASDLRVERLAPAAPLHLLVVDLQRGKDTRRILADLNRCFPDEGDPVATRVREALGPRNVEIVARARQVLDAGDARALGELMASAQQLFDAFVAPASAELASPRLHQVLAAAERTGLAWGGKGVGSQGDGSAQLVARGPEERDALARHLRAELDVTCLPLTLEDGE